jgi:hypothetical protein
MKIEAYANDLKKDRLILLEQVVSFFQDILKGVNFSPHLINQVALLIAKLSEPAQ